MTTTSTLTSRSNTGKCQECKAAPCQYQCPRCSRRTCSLQCCQSHKKRTGCNGKRDRIAYKRLEEMNDSTLQSDFFFLEHVLQTVDGGKRLMKQVGARPSGGPSLASVLEIPTHEKNEQNEEHEEHQPQRKRSRGDHYNNDPMQKLPPKWRQLVHLAKEREVTLLLMPPGMMRNKSNTTHATKDGLIYWKVEFILDNQTILGSKKVSEEATLHEEWMKHDHEDDEGNGSFHFLLKKLPCPANRPKYLKIESRASLKEALRNSTVIEYPTIYVTKNLAKYPLFIEEIEASDPKSDVVSETSEPVPDEEGLLLE